VPVVVWVGNGANPVQDGEKGEELHLHAREKWASFDVLVLECFICMFLLLRFVRTASDCFCQLCSVHRLGHVDVPHQKRASPHYHDLDE
jgi:hypothetical protein